MTQTLFFQAIEISRTFVAILQEDSSLDSTYNSNKSEIDSKYRSKLSELDTKKATRISNASSKNQSAQTNIQDALNALAEVEAKVPEK